jgi:ribosomal protein L16 Arg81 hydroxylase
MRAQDFEQALFDAKLSNPKLRFLQKSLGDRLDSLDWFLRKKALWSEPQNCAQLADTLRGGTLVYVAIESALDPVKTLCRSLFGELKSQISINAYFSAGAEASAFDAHFDPQDTFILQLEGEKEWRLWERERVANPISGYPDWQSLPQPALPADETILMTPGDLLYVPRGVWHWPRSLGDAPSLHLTVTVVMARPVDVLVWLTEEMSNDPRYRATLPLAVYQDGGAETAQSIDAALAFIREKAAAPDAAANVTVTMLRDAIRTVANDKSGKSGRGP